MDVRVEDGLRSLTEREKQTLRLMVRGHDAKSIARTLDLSVHTINERLRAARQKLAVPSSREAARMLLAAEGEAAAPKLLGSDEIGDASHGGEADQETAPVAGVGRSTRPSHIILGASLMTLVLGLLALAAAPQTSPAPTAPASAQAADPAVVDTARRFVTLIDQSRWADSYQATAPSFRKLNTLEAWTAASEQVRQRFGPMVSRTLLSQEEVPAPPHGYQMVKFRTSFANKADAIETVSLDREGGEWRIVGIYVE